MAIENWDKAEVKRLAQVSGKPLEVQCAEAFLKTRWNVHLGTFYTDVASEKIRELDFLAERDFSFSAKNVNHDVIQWRLKLRILGSCKGFAAEQMPATYSIAAHSRSIERPHFICYECGIHGRTVADSMKKRTAENFLRNKGVSSEQQIIGFDIFQRKEDQRKPPQVEYVRKTDRDLYEGLDSAIKAAIFWFKEDRRLDRLRIGGGDQGYIALNIPLLISSLPFWSISIDQGIVGEPELKNSGFHVGLYPSEDKEKPSHPIMSILWSITAIDELTDHLGRLINFFVDEVLCSLNEG